MYGSTSYAIGKLTIDASSSRGAGAISIHRGKWTNLAAPAARATASPERVVFITLEGRTEQRAYLLLSSLFAAVARPIYVLSLIAVLLFAVCSNKASARGFIDRQSTEMARSSAEGIRAITDTIRKIVADLPEGEGGESASTMKYRKGRRKIYSALTRVLSNGGFPTERQLLKLRRWLGRLNELGEESGIFREDPSADVEFSARLAIAQGYVDCALVLVPDVEY